MTSRRTLRNIIGCCLLTTLMWQMHSSAAMAKSCEKKLVVSEFLGPQNAKVRTALVRTLDAQGCDLEKAKSVDDAARRMGVRMRNADDFVKVGKKLKLDGYVEGEVKKKGRRWSADISVRNAYDGEILKSTSFSAASHRALAKQVQRNGWQRLAGAIGVAGAATETEESEQEETPPAAQVSDKPAKSTGIRVAVLRVRGAMGSQVRSNIQETLAAQGHEVVSSAETDAVAEAFVGTPESAEDFAKLGKELNVHAIISARVKKESGAYMLEANAHSGRDGMSLTSTTGVTRNKKNLGTTAQVTAQRLSPKLYYGRLPETDAVAVAKTSEETKDEDTEDQTQEKSSDSGAGRYIALDASLGPWLFSRNLSYTDNIFDQVRGYSVFPAFGMAADLTWFPGAHFSDGFFAHLGLTGAFQTSFGLSSSAEGSTAEFPTSAKAYSIGLVGRVPLGALEILPTFSYGQQSFEIDHANAVTPKPANIPNVAYEYLRIGAGARVSLDDKWALLGSLGYRFVMNAGEIEDEYFPKLSAGAVDLELGAAYRLIAGFELRLTLDMQRYFMSMNPDPGDPYVAGGAIDQWFGATLSAAYRL